MNFTPSHLTPPPLRHLAPPPPVYGVTYALMREKIQFSSGVTITDDFCAACSTVDIVLYLPEDIDSGQSVTSGQSRRKDVVIHSTRLTNLDFAKLGCAIHPVHSYVSVSKELLFERVFPLNC